MPGRLWIPYMSASLPVFPLRFSQFQRKTTSGMGEFLYHHSFLLQVPLPEPNRTQQRASRNVLPFFLLTPSSSVKYLVLCSWMGPWCVCRFQTGLAPYAESLCVAQ